MSVRRDDLLQVEVAYALPERQVIETVQVEPGTTAREAVALSDIESHFPGLDTSGHRLGIFGKVVADDHVLHTGDRVEIYRPLQADPKEVRRQRAAAKKVPD